MDTDVGDSAGKVYADSNVTDSDTSDSGSLDTHHHQTSSWTNIVTGGLNLYTFLVTIEECMVTII